MTAPRRFRQAKQPVASHGTIESRYAPEPSAARTYRALRHRRLCDLLGLWVSEIEPLIFERVDVSPQILVEIGIGAEGDAAPRFLGRVTVDEMIAAGAIG